MNKILSLIWYFLLAGVLPGFAQSDPVLGRAGNFSVLAATEVTNTGITSIAGNLAIHPGRTINDPEGGLVVAGARELGTPIAAQAQTDARQAFDNLSGRTVTRVINGELGNKQILQPGVYHITGNATLSNVLVLDGVGNINSTFIFIIDGDFVSVSPSSPNTSSAGILPQNGAQAKNVFWVVKGKADIGVSTLLMGSILAQRSVTLQTGASLIGSAISLNESVNLDSNTIYLTNLIYSNLTLTKVAQPVTGGFKVGGEVTYLISVRNAGPGTANNVVVRERFGGALEYQSSTPSKGTYDASADVWTIGSLVQGEVAEMTITFKILAGGNIVNNVVATSDTPDPDQDDNEGEAPIDVPCTAPTLAITGNDVFCTGVATSSYTVTEVAGATYNYEVSGGLTIVSRSGNTVVLGLGTSTAGGTLTARVTDRCGATYTVTKAIGVQSIPVAPVITGNTNVCANTENTYTATGVAGNATYEWVVTGGLQIIRGEGTNAVVVRAGNTGGTLTVRATNACGTGANSAPLAVNVTVPPVAPTAIVGSADVCAGTEQTYSVAAVPGATSYVWTVPAGWQIIGESGTTVTTTTPQIRVRTGANSGNITVTAQNTCQGGTATLAVVVSPGAPARPGAISASAAACAGTQVTYSVAPVTNATNYIWTLPAGWNAGGATGTVTTTGPSIVVTVGSGAGEIRVRAANGCGNSDESTLTVTPGTAPGAVGAITGPTQVCASTTGLQFSISPVAGATTYTWNLPAGWVITSGAGTTSITVTAGAAAGSLQLSVTASNVCGATTATTTITVREPLTIAGGITDNSNICDGLSYSISAVSGAVSYTWTVPAGFTITAGQGTTSIRVRVDNPNAAGQVTVVANNGICNGPAASATIDLSLIDAELNIPKAFSPNGDGINDNWVISNITKYSDTEVIIFNRWGSEVFRTSNYQNNWAGNGLGQGTYFYRLRVRQCDGSNKDFTGYVSIYR